jgi:hypothetical protein
MKDTYLSLLRHLLTAIGAVLVARGYINDSALTDIVGATIGLVGAVWGPVDEYLAAKNSKIAATQAALAQASIPPAPPSAS